MHDLAELFDTFWEEVKACLTSMNSEHHLSDYEADRGISEFRAALQRHEAEDSIYHRNPEFVANIIAHGRETGYPDPTNVPVAEQVA